MTIQTRSDINDENTFKSALILLSKKIKSKNQATPELNAIVENGLNVTQEVDTPYESQGVFSKLSQYLLYKVAFELWSYQHQFLLDSLESTRQQGFRDHAQLILRHERVATNLFHALQSLASVNDPDSLRDSWLAAWKQTISEISEFLEIPITPSKKPKQRRSKFVLSFSDMSPDMRYAIIATVTFVLGILIATLLLIRR